MEGPPPDPVVSANVYCHGRLDELIHGAIAPLRREMATESPGDPWRLWFARYPRRGEHLKVRIHGPVAAAPRLREMLAGSVERAFSVLPETVPDERTENRGLPPLDDEDEVAGLHPDRSLLWTRYRRSYVTLGGGPFLDDDLYVALLTTCLARGCDIVLASLRPNAGGQFSPGSRQAALFKLALGGLAAAGLSRRESVIYLTYHRDWLLRFATAQAKAGPEKTRELIAQLDQRAERMASALEPLRCAAEATLETTLQETLDPADARWREAVGDLTLYLRRFAGDPAYELDTFAADVTFSPLFKVFHGLANQLGLSMLNEALAHHLLLRAVTA